MGCMTSSWTVFLLVGGEVINCQHCQPSGSVTSLGSMCLQACRQQTVNFLPLVGVSVSAKQLRTQS